MESVVDTLAIYMRFIGIHDFGNALHRAAVALDGVCNQIRRSPIRTVVAKVTAVGELTPLSLPDALWLASCRRTPEISSYPMGEVAERAFKRTLVWLALYNGQEQPQKVDGDLKSLQKNMRKAIEQRKQTGILGFFLTEYLYEVCQDSNRRIKTGTKNDPCYRFHFPDGKKPKSLAIELQDESVLLEYCGQISDDCKSELLQSVKANKSDGLIRKLEELYLQWMGGLPRKKKNKTSRKPSLNVVVGNKSWSELKRKFALDPDAKRLLLHIKKANVSYNETAVETFLARMTGEDDFRLHSLSRDLLDIGVVVYIADQAVKRDCTLQRRLDILMPVRHPKEWNGVKDLLTETISFLGRDEVHFHFTKKKEKAEPVKFKVTPGKKCVSLFSGGLDSAAGAVQLLEDGLDPVLVSHHANGFTSGVQNILVGKLNKKRTEPIERLNLYVNKANGAKVSNPLGNFPRSPMTQFLRSFMFLSVAAVVAIEAHIHKLFIFENGPVALNLMFSEGRLNTRTAHPRFIACYQLLIEKLFKVKLEIKNPFLVETKGEVVGRFSAPDRRGMIRLTNSCWNAFAVPLRAKRMGKPGYKKYHHDGDCLPCIIRRGSIIHAKLNTSDAPYLVDVFSEYPTFRMPVQVMIADYLRFCANIIRMGDAEFMLEHPDVSVCAPGVDPKSLISMYRRHAAEMLESFRTNGLPETKKLLLPLPK